MALAAPLLADFDARQWQYQRTVRVETAGRVNAVILDRAIYAGAQPGLNDLRLALNGRETPFVLSSVHGAVTDNELPPAEFNRVVVPGRGLQLTLDAGRGHRHNRLRIATQLLNFRIPVKIETSEDAQAWAIARSDGSVFDFTQADRHAAVLSLDYPLSTRRYVRATFIGWMHADAVASAWLTLHSETSTAWQTLATATPARVEKDGVTNLEFDLGDAHLPYARIRLDSATARFYRACDVESSDNGKDWTYLSTQAIYRLDGEESLALSYSGSCERYVRLRVHNGQDRPLAADQAAFDAVEQRLQFLPPAAGEYALYYGNSKAQAPAYDLGMILARRAPEQAIVVAAGTQRLTPDYRPPEPPAKPWSERHMEVLYVTLGLALAGMGWYCVRLLRAVKRAA
ncbi:MAG: DUF3999 family protein [Bryobacteraceae bacterium]